mmetsp:Transcript_15715/g.24417  ORF Transcript_15715/g.24417 Transcript_15715/m.24417 type:complete len:88 (-) Transcript_15715:503-766(-)
MKITQCIPSESAVALFALEYSNRFPSVVLYSSSLTLKHHVKSITPPITNGRYHPHEETKILTGLIMKSDALVALAVRVKKITSDDQI